MLLRSSLLLVAAALATPGPHSTEPEPLRWRIAPGGSLPIKPPPSTESLRRRGRTLFETRCAPCHGERGDGQGPLAQRLRPHPTDFTRAVYKVRSTPTGTLPTALDLLQTVSRGMHGTAMSPWRALPARDRWALVATLQSFSPRFTEEPPGRPIQVPIPPRVTGDILDHGERLYTRLRCIACHGDSGAGDGPSGAEYRRRGDREVRIRDFTRGRFIRGPEMEDLYLTLRVGIDGTPMGSYDALSDDEIWAVAAYVRALVRDRPIEDLPPASAPPPGP
jgi:mono/diheme cytochrome c family protein